MGSLHGGIVGEDRSGNIFIDSCTNRGKISKSSVSGGGIVGVSFKNRDDKSVIKRSYNYGNVGTSNGTNSGYGAGIVGTMKGVIEECYNYGTVQSEYAAGIVSGAHYNELDINNCSNYAEITGDTNSGGICGSISTESIIYNCVNTGNITLKDDSGYNGGIAASASKIVNCYNIGNVINYNPELTPGSLCGGICGTGKDIVNCFNSGNIKSSAYAGGIIASGNNIENCYNIGNIESNSITGGIGGGTLNVTKCYNTGNVLGNSGNPTGGIAGWITKGIECYNTGNVKNDEISTLGEIAQAREAMTLENCYFLQKETNAPANGATPKSKEEMDEIMDMQKFVDLLNQKVQEHNANEENTIKLKSWKLENGKPVFAE